MWIVILFYLALTITGLSFMKQGMSNTSIEFVKNGVPFIAVDSKLDIRVVIGAAMYATSFVTWLFILKKFNLSYIYPIVTGISYVLVLAVSYFVLGERFTLQKFFGTALILAGVLLVYRNNL